jgi:hypothetical protein
LQKCRFFGIFEKIKNGKKELNHSVHDCTLKNIHK